MCNRNGTCSAPGTPFAIILLVRACSGKHVHLEIGYRYRVAGIF